MKQEKDRPENHVAAAELSMEGNYKQIDGIINNEPPKPSVRDTLNQYKEDAGETQNAPATLPRGPEVSRCS